MKSSASTAKPITSTSKESEDLFLPIGRKDIVNPFLADEEYLAHSDNESITAEDVEKRIISDNDEKRVQERNGEVF